MSIINNGKITISGRLIVSEIPPWFKLSLGETIKIENPVDKTHIDGLFSINYSGEEFGSYVGTFYHEV